MRRTILFLFSLASLAILQAQSPAPDRVVIYDMREDPTMATFAGYPPVKGFYGLEIDDYFRTAAILYRIEDKVYRAEVGLKIDGNQLTIRNRKKKKVFIRDKDVLYPSECPPEKSGWRYGASFGKHTVRRKDEAGIRLIVSTIQLEFEHQLQRCADPLSECGEGGCGEWDVTKSTAYAAAAAASAAKPAFKVPYDATDEEPAAPKLTLSKALLEAKMTADELISTFKEEIDTILPMQMNTLTVVATAYATTPFPYAAMVEPGIEQRGLKIGVVIKRYTPTDNQQTVTIKLQPLLAEFQAGQPGKCGTWDSGSNRTMFDVRGKPAMYVYTPGSTTTDAPTQESSALHVCGNTFFATVESPMNRPKDYLFAIYDALPADLIEQHVGAATLQK